jgi:hypothetical protein
VAAADNHIKEQEAEETPAVRKERRLRINYLWFVKHLPFILYLSLLALIYIANGHYADKTIRKINHTRHEIKELNWQYLDIKSDLMFHSKFSEVAKAVAPAGLKELDEPPFRITVDSMQNDQPSKP